MSKHAHARAEPRGRCQRTCISMRVRGGANAGSWPSSREPGQDEHDQDTHRPGDVRAYNKVFGNSLFAEDGGRAGGGGSPARRMAWTAQEGGNDSDTDQGAPRARSPPHGNEGRAAVPAQPAPRARTPPSGSYVVTQGPHATG